jgi:DNA uptake protein ComE-like DNA-binding protein
MKLNNEPLKNWFGFTRRERRSSSILLIIIIFIIGSRYLLPEKNIEIENYGIFLSDTETSEMIADDDISTGNMSFPLNQAPASYDTLKNPVFGERKSHSTIIYSSSGRKLRNPSGMQQKAPIDINVCDSAALIALPGIGPVLSARIIKYRKMLGGFASVDQLKEVYGLPEETYEMIKGRLYADSSGIRKININSSGYKELFRIPYIEKYEVTAILKYRELEGMIKSIEDLEENKILTPEKAEKVAPYLDFR